MADFQKGEVGGRILRAWASVFIGVAFFVAAVWMNRSESGLRCSVKWLLAGFVLDILWSALQAATFYLQVLPKPLVTQWQRAFSLRELIRTNRISGMAYEPSWLAGEISTLYLPWLIAALLVREHITRYKWLVPTLLVLAAALLLATFSRGGLLTAVVASGLTLGLAGGTQIRPDGRGFFQDGLRVAACFGVWA